MVFHLNDETIENFASLVPLKRQEEVRNGLQDLKSWLTLNPDTHTLLENLLISDAATIALTEDAIRYEIAQILLLRASLGATITEEASSVSPDIGGAIQSIESTLDKLRNYINPLNKDHLHAASRHISRLQEKAAKEQEERKLEWRKRNFLKAFQDWRYQILHKAVRNTGKIDEEEWYFVCLEWETIASIKFLQSNSDGARVVEVWQLFEDRKIIKKVGKIIFAKDSSDKVYRIDTEFNPWSAWWPCMYEKVIHDGKVTFFDGGYQIVLSNRWLIIDNDANLEPPYKGDCKKNWFYWWDRWWEIYSYR